MFQKNWERRRTDLNHDWLSNEYLRHIKALEHYLHLLIVDEKKEFRADIKRLVINVFPQWKEKKADLYMLIDDIETELSPINLFNIPPMKKLNYYEKGWLKQLINELWRRKNEVRTNIESLSSLCATIDIAYCELATIISTIDIMKDDLIVIDSIKLKDYISLCTELRLQLSNLVNLEKIL